MLVELTQNFFILQNFVVSCTFYPNLPIFLHRYICHICDILQFWWIYPNRIFNAAHKKPSDFSLRMAVQVNWAKKSEILVKAPLHPGNVAIYLDTGEIISFIQFKWLLILLVKRIQVKTWFEFKGIWSMIKVFETDVCQCKGVTGINEVWQYRSLFGQLLCPAPPT